jgi:ATP-dependent Zn protease
MEAGRSTTLHASPSHCHADVCSLRSVEAYEVAVRHVAENREALDAITEALLEKETLTGEIFNTGQHT